MNDNDKKIDSIYHKTLLVNQLSSEVNEITLQQEHKLNDIEDNIIDLQKTTKDTLNTVIKEQEHQHNNKNNNCCIAFFILLFIVFIILLTFQ
jgi:t-SNARE complex subunit (syntaxin)